MKRRGVYVRTSEGDEFDLFHEAARSRAALRRILKLAGEGKIQTVFARGLNKQSRIVAGC